MLKELATASFIIVLAFTMGAQYLGNKTAIPPAGQVPETVVASTDAPAPASRKKTETKKESPAEAVAAPAASSGETVMLAADSRGHFEAELQSEGVSFRAMVDTGASIIAVPRTLAEKLGHFPDQSAFTVSISTANGVIKAAPVKLREVRLRGITVRDVDAVIVPDERLERPLLGMSFLRKLKSFSVKDDRLTLVN